MHINLFKKKRKKHAISTDDCPPPSNTNIIQKIVNVCTPRKGAVRHSALYTETPVNTPEQRPNARHTYDFSEGGMSPISPVSIEHESKFKDEKKEISSVNPTAGNVQQATAPIMSPIQVMTPKRVLVTSNHSEQSSEVTSENLRELSDQMRLSVNNKQYSDVMIRVGPQNQIVYAHRIILANRSTYFNNLFTQQSSVMDQRFMKLDKPDVQPEVFLKVIEYLYTGSIRMKQDDVLEILALAEEFGVNSLKDMCAKFIQDNIDTENACMLLETSREFNCHGLTHFCLNYIDKHISRVLSSKGWLDLSEDTLILIIKRNELHLAAKEEVEIFHAVYSWAKKKAKDTNTEDVAKVAENVLQYIRFPLMTSEQLSSIVEPTNFVPQALLFEAYKHLLVPEKSEKAARFMPRAGTCFSI